MWKDRNKNSNKSKAEKAVKAFWGGRYEKGMEKKAAIGNNGYIEEAEAFRIWELFEKGQEHHRVSGIYSDSDICHRFYEGDQWRGIEGGDDMPVLNFIKPVGRYKISSIAQNQTRIVYSPMQNDPVFGDICARLTELANSQWERDNMEGISWSVIKNAFITGDHYLYSVPDGYDESSPFPWNPRIRSRLIPKTQLHFADEQNPDINEQLYIIIAERMPVEQVKKLAKFHGASDRTLERIIPDRDDESICGKREGFTQGFGNEEDGKCTLLLYMEKTAKGIKFCRVTRDALCMPMQVIKGLTLYPISGMRWEERAGSARGLSGMKHLIPNQQEVNRTAARRALAVKRFSFPTLAYDKTAISNIEQLSQIGASIAIDNARDNPIDRIIQYLNPAPIAGDAERLQNELMNLSRDLEGAGDAATGIIDPTRASGEAIKAARDQAAIPLNEQAALYRGFVEQVARVWLGLWTAYGSNGLFCGRDTQGNPVLIPGEDMESLRAEAKVDISPVDPYSRLSQEIAMERLLAAGHITFSEYVEALDDTSGVPKAKLKSILSARGEQSGGENGFGRTGGEKTAEGGDGNALQQL